MTFEVNGFDVSKWQGEIDWNTFVTKGDFFYIRAGSIDMSGVCYEDTQLQLNAKLSIPLGKPVGFYWYFRPKFSAQAQAKYFANLLSHIDNWELYPVVDVEEDNGKSPSAVAAGVWQFISYISKEFACPCMIYTSPGFWNDYVKSTTWARDVPLWVAQWGSNDTPYLPRDWSYHGKTALFWQWQVATNGLDYGVKSKGLDLDRFVGTREQFNNMFGASVPEPPPAELSDSEKVAILWREAKKNTSWDFSK